MGNNVDGEGLDQTLPEWPVPDVSKMGYNPANFAYWIGEEPWTPGVQGVVFDQFY